MRTVRIIVTGRVQGVFFRKFTVEAANKHGVRGFVRNQPDGSVFIEASGDEQQLESFISWCYKGSPYGKVESVNITDTTYAEHTSFDIR